MSDVLSFYRALSSKKPVMDQEWFAESRGYDLLIKTPDGIVPASEASPETFNRVIGICRFLANYFTDETWSDAVAWVDLDYQPKTDRVCLLHEMLNTDPLRRPFILDFDGRELVISSCEFEDKEVIQ